MKKSTFFIFLLFSFLYNNCASLKNENMKKRLESLGKEILLYAKAGNYDNRSLPKDLVFIGNNTFWNILEITEPIDSIKIIIHDSKDFGEESDYILDIGTHIGLRMKYDSNLDKFHILGYSGALSKKDEFHQKKITALNKYLHEIGKIKPEIGLEGMIIHKTTKLQLFEKYDEKLFNQLGFFFSFQNDTLAKLYISTYQIETEKGIRPGTTFKSNIISTYGEPISTKDSFYFLDKTIINVELLIYKGMSFILLKDELMLIEIKKDE